MGPSHRRMGGDGAQEALSSFGTLDPSQLGREIEIVPADDAVFDEAIAGLGDFLLLLFGVNELAGIADGDGSGEAIGELDFVELFLDSLPQLEVVDIAQDEQGLDDLTEGLHGTIETMLA